MFQGYGAKIIKKTIAKNGAGCWMLGAGDKGVRHRHKIYGFRQFGLKSLRKGL